VTQLTATQNDSNVAMRVHGDSTRTLTVFLQLIALNVSLMSYFGVKSYTAHSSKYFLTIEHVIQDLSDDLTLTWPGNIQAVCNIPGPGQTIEVSK